jgi:hypothetical protein
MKTIAPYKIPELNIEGLTNYDIAACTNREVKVINRLVTRPSFQNLCKTNGYELVTVGTKEENKIGRPRQYIYMPTKAAKALVATANWKEGHQYLDFLLECEIAATQALPKALQEIERLKAAINQKALPEPRRKKALVPVWQPSLWDMPVCTGFEYVDANEANEFDAAWAKNVHCNKILKGLQAAQEEAQTRMNAGLRLVKMSNQG